MPARGRLARWVGVPRCRLLPAGGRLLTGASWALLALGVCNSAPRGRPIRGRPVGGHLACATSIATPRLHNIAGATLLAQHVLHRVACVTHLSPHEYKLVVHTTSLN